MQDTRRRRRSAARAEKIRTSREGQANQDPEADPAEADPGIAEHNNENRLQNDIHFKIQISQIDIEAMADQLARGASPETDVMPEAIPLARAKAAMGSTDQKQAQNLSVSHEKQGRTSSAWPLEASKDYAVQKRKSFE